jgi:excisionase family DNA binding protein
MKQKEEKRADAKVSEYLNSDEASTFLGISKSTLHKMCHRRQITYFKPNGKLVFFKKNDLMQFLENGKVLSVEEEYKLKQVKITLGS